MRWHDRAFDSLTVDELHAIYSLRQAVFVVEQACIYRDVDELDPHCRHLWASGETSSTDVYAYLRVVPPGQKYPEASIGRVVVAPAHRKGGLGRELMARGIAAMGEQPIRLSAQAYLEAFYAGLGFVRVTADYDEDGIPHYEGLRG